MKKTRLLVYASIFIVISYVSTHYRMLPLTDHTDNEIKKLAEKVVLNDIHRQIQTSLEAQYPSLPEKEKAGIIHDKMRSFVNENRGSLKASITEGYEALKKSMDRDLEKNLLVGADSYYYLGLTNNIIEKGSVSSKIKHGLYFNPLMMAPLGNWYYFDYHPYVGFAVYKFMSSINDNLSVAQGVAYTPIFLSLVILLLYLVFLYRLNISVAPAFLSALFFMGAPMFFQRSLYGWYDTDPYNILFPLLIIFLLISALLENIDGSRKRKIIFAALATSLYTMFWSGWTYIPICMIFLFASIILYNLAIKDRREVNNLIYLFFMYFIILFVSIVIFRGKDGLMFSLRDTFSRIFVFTKGSFNLWPDTFITVGELKKTGLHKAAVLSGGRIYSSVAFIGIFYIFLKMRFHKANKEHFYAASIISSFFLVPLIMTLNAERFSILMVPPLAVSIAIFSNDCYGKLMTFKNTAYRIFLWLIIFFAVLVGLASLRMSSMQKTSIIYDKTWNDALTYINKNTPEDAIINTWWSPGHFITAIAKRGVIFDGATLEKPVGYWISKALISENEKEAVGILRMINLSGNKAVDFMVGKGLKLSTSVNLLKRLVVLDKDKAAAILSTLFDRKSVDRLIEMTHGGMPHVYVLIYKDLGEKPVLLEFLGNWGFKNAETFAALKKVDPKAARKLIRDKADNNYVKLLWSISGGPQYFKDRDAELKRTGDIVYFPDGISINVLSHTITISDESPLLKQNLRDLIYRSGDELHKKTFNVNGKISILLLGEEDQYSIVQADSRLADSTVFKMFFFEGAGLHYFHKVFHEKAVDNSNEILIYKMSSPGSK